MKKIYLLSIAAFFSCTQYQNKSDVKLNCFFKTNSSRTLIELTPEGEQFLENIYFEYSLKTIKLKMECMKSISYTGKTYTNEEINTDEDIEKKEKRALKNFFIATCFLVAKENHAVIKFIESINGYSSYTNFLLRIIYGKNILKNRIFYASVEKDECNAFYKYQYENFLAKYIDLLSYDYSTPQFRVSPREEKFTKNPKLFQKESYEDQRITCKTEHYCPIKSVPPKKRTQLNLVPKKCNSVSMKNKNTERDEEYLDKHGCKIFSNQSLKKSFCNNKEYTQLTDRIEATERKNYFAPQTPVKRKKSIKPTPRASNELGFSEEKKAELINTGSSVAKSRSRKKIFDLPANSSKHNLNNYSNGPINNNCRDRAELEDLVRKKLGGELIKTAHPKSKNI